MAFAEDIHKHKHSKLKNVGPDDHHRKWGLFDEPSWIRTLYSPLGTFTKVGVTLLGVGGWHPDWVSHPRPIYNEADGKYWVYFAGGNTNRSIGLAIGTSLKSALTEITDGIGGTSRVLNPSGTAGAFDETGVSFPTVIYDPLDVAAKRWKMLFNGRNGAGVYEKIGYAYSADGKSWTKYANNPVFEIADRRVDSAALFRLGNKFYLLYRQTLVDPQQIGLAYSDDCITWTQYPNNPVLQLGSAGEWDDNVVAYVTLYFDQGTFYMVYSGKQATGLYKMGLALSTNCFSWTKLPFNPVLTDTVSVSTGCLIRIEDEFILVYEQNIPKSIRSATIP
ncbi:hypothetical protein E3J74_06025 [Candidatus Bathyarchaeota archaeon]|nr:MAG: hypothetical protein E3J74_06025 [Candidatus Bathyarchaeota archaeon]